jgi:hypothetical protein
MSGSSSGVCLVPWQPGNVVGQSAPLYAAETFGSNVTVLMATILRKLAQTSMFVVLPVTGSADHLSVLLAGCHCQAVTTITVTHSRCSWRCDFQF